MKPYGAVQTPKFAQKYSSEFEKLLVTNALSYGSSRLVKKSKFLVLPANIRIQNNMLSTNTLAYQSWSHGYKTFLSVIYGFL